MKYSDLISFNPIEDVIQLTTADDANRAKEYVKSYVMSDTMAANLKSPVLDQLQMDEVVDNKGVLVVGNYGTGKSHLMSVISSIAKDADNLQYLQNKNFAKEMECIAGKFEVLRIEIGGVTMSLREILFGFIEDDFAARGIDFEVPDFDTVRDNKKLIRDMMMAFSAKYPDKGYLIVVDEFLSYLTSRDERQIVLDLEFFRALGEMCSKSKLRVIFGVQEKIFDNPRFSFVSDTLKHVSDRFTQIVITKEATSYVVSERILKKTPEQKALIRKHLEKFSMLYTGMSSRMDEFVDLFPIHPSYIDVFNKIYLIENRHILKNISMTIRDIFNRDVPENEPGIISFDNYWPAIKSNGLLKSDVTINRVVTASGQLEDIINRAFPKPAYKPLAIKIIYALSVHRLTTNGLDVHFGLTAENLKDDLCLFMPMPEQDADFLLALIKTTLKDIMTTVSGQFIIYNDANNQYYIDVDKIVDYDEKIKQKASIMATRKMRERYADIDRKLLPLLPDNREKLENIKNKIPKAGNISEYIWKNAGYPVYQNTDIVYYDEAVKGLEAQLSALSKAEKFIFMEYHAIEDAEAWKKIQKVLEERVQAGVEVRVFYDDMGSIGFINTDFVKKMEQIGIHCRVFNPFMPGLNVFLNNRDHRKITVIDGKVAFTGGYNLANEYFNYTNPYGQWKDTGIRLEGDAVQSLTATFLEMWNAANDRNNNEDFSKYFIRSEYKADQNGFVQPYADSPMDDEQVGEEVYISMVNKAEKYCWFITPYLIITDEMTHALCLAAKRGIDVRIITPGIPDKKMIYSVTRSFYHGLVKNGVRIYEWTPGFCHAKMSVADDCMATCGTINLDYRSLYHHFENGCFMADSPAVLSIRNDLEETMKECREVTEQYRTGRSAYLRLGQLFMRLFAGLL